MPVPVKFAVCGLSLALSLTTNCPVLVPVVVGAKTTLIVHVGAHPPPRFAPQFVADTAKSPVVEITMLFSTGPVLLKVNVFGVLVRPTPRFPKLKALGVSVTLAASPVPLRLAVCVSGLSGPPMLSLTLNCPFLVPTAEGVKVTLIVQLLLGARLVPQVVADIAKSPAVAITIWFTASVAIKVNVFAALVVLTNCVPKLIAAGVRCTPPSAVPVPVKFAVCGLSLALSLTTTCPVLVPVVVGAKVTWNWHEAVPFSPPRLVPHLLFDTAKSPVVEITMLFSTGPVLKVNVFGVLVRPTPRFPKLTTLGVSVTLAATPVPVRLAVCVCEPTVPTTSLTLNCPVLLLASDGVKVTSMVHSLLAARLVPQVDDDTAKSPVVDIAILFSGITSLLSKVNVFAALVVLTNCGANVTAAGTRSTPPPAQPVPVRPAVCGLSGALSVNVSAPVRGPSAMGVKVTLTVQFVPASKASPHVVEEMAKLALAVMLLMVSEAVPVLVIVTVWGALVVWMVSLPKLSEVGESVTAGTPFTCCISTGEVLPWKFASPL